MSRRDSIRMSDEEIAEFLDANQTITIVSQGPGGFPHPMPMWFVRNPEGAIRMTTYRSSQKTKNIERDPRVALMAETGTTYDELRGVVIYGLAELITTAALVTETMVDIARKNRVESDIGQSMDKAATKRILIRVAPERVTSWDHRKLGGVY